MHNEKLAQAIEAYKSGEKSSAKKLLIAIVQSEPNHEDAWLWLAGCVESLEQREDCLQKVLSINPNNDLARQALTKIAELRVLQKDLYGPLKASPSMDLAAPRATHQNTMSLAKSAEEGRNFEEAYKYYSQVLEQEIDSPEAWFGKGRCAAWLSSINSERITESINCIKSGLEARASNTETVSTSVEAMVEAVVSYAHMVIAYVDGQDLPHNPRVSATFIVDPIMGGLAAGAENARRARFVEKLNDEFWKIYRPPVLTGIRFAWSLAKTKDVAVCICEILSTVFDSGKLKNNIKDGFCQGIQDITMEIPGIFPEISVPKRRSKWF